MFISKNTLSYALQGNKMDDMSFRLIKISDIIYTTLICCVVVLSTLRLMERSVFAWIETLLDSISSAEATTAPNRILVFCLFYFLFSLFAVSAYILRNAIEMIPSPFHGMRGLNHIKLSEISDISSLLLIILIVQTPMYNKLMNVLMN